MSEIKPASAQRGDLVQWVAQRTWHHSGLGLVVETHYDRMHGWSYRVLWNADAEEIPGCRGIWYTEEDFDEKYIVVI